MKKLLSMVLALVLLSTLTLPVMAEEVTYIAAPYTVADTTNGPTEYLEPVFYQNEGGPAIGVTLVGVNQVDGKYFKDSDNDKELDVFEDWRLPTAERVADLLPKLSKEQRLGMLANQLMASPTASKVEDVMDENGKVKLDQLITLSEDPFNLTLKEELGKDENGKDLPSKRQNATGMLLTFENRSGVLRATTDVETGALWTNALNMTTEYGSVVKNQPTVPFTILANPQNVMGAPGKPGFGGMGTTSLAFGAAVMGDVANGGDYGLVERFASLDRGVWDAKGISRMYGPQIDLVTDPRWDRNSGTYTEDPEVMSGIAKALVLGYQSGADGVQDGDVSLVIKHFPGDGASYNGFESHSEVGKNRIYSIPNSLEKYHLPAFQVAIDNGLTGIMPGYSIDAMEGDLGNVIQTYRGVNLAAEGLANAFNKTILQTLLRDTMGFTGYINTDSGVIVEKDYGVEELSHAERVALALEAGSDIIGDWFVPSLDYTAIYEASEQNLISDVALDRANTNHLTTLMNMGQFENPYKNMEESVAYMTDNAEALTAMGKEISQKSVVLMKNSNETLPLTDASKKVFIATFTEKGEDEKAYESIKTAFETEGYTIVEKASQADIAFLNVAPGGVIRGEYMNVLDLVDELEVPEIKFPDSYEKTGDTTEVTTLSDVDDIEEIAEEVHANGGKVIASITISSPWILTNLEPYCDALISDFNTSIEARMDVLTGRYNPTGKLPITMVACNEVIAVNEVEENGFKFEKCVSPNDVPGYDKDQYIAEDVLAQSPSGSYAYQDTDGNVYKAWHGLSY